MVWPIKDRAADMERGYILNKTACKNAREVIESKKPSEKDRKSN